MLVFQHTWAEGLLGFRSTGTIIAWLPMFLFVVLFGLSMDYHVFVVSRIRELAVRGMPTRDAVRQGIIGSAGAVTSAAVVMVAVFAIFATLSALEFKQMGVGLAAAVLIDATLVRAVLLPAAMTLLGRWNWWGPAVLRRRPTRARVCPWSAGRRLTCGFASLTAPDSSCQGLPAVCAPVDSARAEPRTRTRRESHMYAIEAEGLVKRFGETTALAGVDLAVRPGTVLGVLGPNGAGKTTAVRVLATLLRPDGGQRAGRRAGRGRPTPRGCAGWSG